MHYILVTLGLLLAYPLYKIYAGFKVPKSLSHLPTVSVFDFMVSLFTKESNGDRATRLWPSDIGGDGLSMVWLAGEMQLVVSSAKLCKEMFNDANNFHKGVPGKVNLNNLMAEFFGDSNIVQSDGEIWKQHRRTINPAFKKSWNTEMFGIPAKELIDIFDEQSGKPIVINELMQKLTLDVLGKGLLNIDFKALKSKEESRLLQLYNRVMEGIFNPIYIIFAFLEGWVPSRQKLIEECKELRQHFKDIIKQRYQEIESGVEKGDILSLTIKASLEGESMSDSDIVNNLATFFLAGHDTTAHTLTSNLYFLAKYPEVQTKVRNEVLQIMGDAKDVIPTIDQQKQFTYMNQVIKESMRLITNIGIVSRLCVKDTKLSNGIIVPKNTKINILQWSGHHDPQVFPDPHSFNPDRFDDPHNLQSQYWTPFGVGTRMCIGMNFSLIEQRVVMAMLLQKFTIELGPKSKQLDKPKLNIAGLNHPVDLDLVFKPRV